MGLEQRLRGDLNRDAEQIVPDVERNLGAVEARAQRRSAIGAPTLLIAAALIALAFVYRFGTSSTGVGAPSPSPTIARALPSTSASVAPTYDAIAGTYVVTLDQTAGAIASGHLGGTWTMRLLPDGEMLLSPPTTFVYGSVAPSGIAFSTTGDRFRTNLFYNDFCNSVGTYTWALEGGRLSFAPEDETCAIRQTLLSTAAWQAAP